MDRTQPSLRGAPGFARGVLCRKGHDEWRVVLNDEKPSGRQNVCVPCRRASAIAWYHRMDAEEKERWLRASRRRKKLKTMALAEAGRRD